MLESTRQMAPPCCDSLWIFYCWDGPT